LFQKPSPLMLATHQVVSWNWSKQKVRIISNAIKLRSQAKNRWWKKRHQINFWIWSAKTWNHQQPCNAGLPRSWLISRLWWKNKSRQPKNWKPNRMNKKSQSKNRSSNLSLRTSKNRNQRQRLKITRKNWGSFQKIYFTCKTKYGKSRSGSSSIWGPRSRDFRDSNFIVILNKNLSSLPKGKTTLASLLSRRRRDPEHILTLLTSSRSKDQYLHWNGLKFCSGHVEIMCLTLGQRELQAAKALMRRCHSIGLKGMEILTSLGAGLTAVSLAP